MPKCVEGEKSRMGFDTPESKKWRSRGTLLSINDNGYFVTLQKLSM